MGGSGSSTHHTREVLLQQIMDRPGITFSRLMRLLDLNEGTLRYHLNYLEREERIRSRKEGASRVYYSLVHDPSQRSNAGGLTLGQRRVLSTIRKFPGIGASEIQGHTNLTRDSLNGILNRLKKEHIIWEVQNGHGAGYELITRERMLEEMLLDIVERFLRREMDQSTFLRMKDWIEEERRNPRK